MREVPAVITPSLTCSSPEAMRSRVLLPHPEGPTTETNSPLATVRSTPDSAVVPSGKVIATSRKSRIVEPVTSWVGAGAIAVMASPAFQ